MTAWQPHPVELRRPLADTETATAYTSSSASSCIATSPAP